MTHIPLLMRLRRALGNATSADDIRLLRTRLIEAGAERLPHDAFGLDPMTCALQAAVVVVEEMSLRRAAVWALMLRPVVAAGKYDVAAAERDFGAEVARIVSGLMRIDELYAKSQATETENFRSLLLTLSDDVRVVLIMIADRVNLMRQIRDCGTDDERQRVARDAAAVYAPLAHKLGLYALKSELEDLSLKYTEHDVYYHIKDKLSATKAARDRYIEAFIRPVEQKLQAAGLTFHIKGRTKSIHSIYQKMKRQRCPFEGVYDLFAIRIILHSAPEREKMECWQVYSIVADMYQPNPKRLRDWLSVPKSNGYESLHTTVMGPEGKWVEVQIRTERMDEVAEHGLAAHWRYKGIRGEGGLDQWLAAVREALEATESGDTEAMDRLKLELRAEEVYVFTPKGDLFKLAQGATVLDFAFHIHTRVGSHCTGGRVNGRNVKLGTVLHSGDQVEILTSTTQTPSPRWLTMVATARARTKIKQALKEMAAQGVDLAREDLERKMRNRKIDLDDGTMMRLMARMGYKVATDFYQALSDGTIDAADVIERYLEQQRRDHATATNTDATPTRSAEGYSLTHPTPETARGRDDVLVIGRGLRGLDYRLSRCCNPIYGDDVFGFVSAQGGINIHRTDCPNAPDLHSRYAYRIIRAQWAGKAEGTQYPAQLHVVGHDDIGIVTNITSIISKEEGLLLRNISIDAHDGLFSGTLTVMVSDTARLQTLVKKLRTVKGVKQVSRG